MIKFAKANYLSLLLLFLIILIFFLLRLPQLTLQPIFADEAIYVRWAQVMKAEPTLRFISLQDGKTPLYMWLLIPFLGLQDPLWAGRLLSVLAGFLSLLGIIMISWRFINKRVALWAALLMAVTPYIVFFDRLALVDSLFTTFSVWSLFLGLLLVEYMRIDLAMILGYSLGLELLTKTPGLFNLLTIPVTAVAMVKHKNHSLKFLKLISLWVVAVSIALVIFNLLRLGPGFGNLSARDQDYAFTPWQILHHPLDPFIPHGRDFLDLGRHLITWPIFLLVLFGLPLTVVKRNHFLWAILLWGLIPLLALLAILKPFTARYTLFTIPPMLVLAAWTVDWLILKLKIRGLTLIILLLVLVQSLFFDYQLLKNPELADLPVNERHGYLEDWTAGTGLSSIAKFLIDQAKQGQVVVGTVGFFGTLPDGLNIYLDRYNHQAASANQVIVIPSNATVSAALQKAALLHPTYLVASRSQFGHTGNNLKLILGYPKAKPLLGNDQDTMLLFEVLPRSI